jgi:DNA-binding MarR family transcriptional regulator
MDDAGARPALRVDRREGAPDDPVGDVDERRCGSHTNNHSCTTIVVNRCCRVHAMPPDPVGDALLDVVIAAQLAGLALTDAALSRIRARGHPALRTSHGYVFQHLLAGPITIGELAERLGVTQQAASKTAVELTAAGYLLRVPDPTDGRIRRVELTELGHDAVTVSRAIRAELGAELTAKLGAEEVEAAHRTLLAAIDVVGGMEDVRHRRVRPAG